MFPVTTTKRTVVELDIDVVMNKKIVAFTEESAGHVYTCSVSTRI